MISWTGKQYWSAIAGAIKALLLSIVVGLAVMFPMAVMLEIARPPFLGSSSF